MTAFNRIGRYLTFTIRTDLCDRLCRFLRLFVFILPDSQFRQLIDTDVYKRQVLPDTVPSRVYALAEEITQGASTDYDKLKQIEVWLSGLAYTTSPSVCPKGQDFTCLLYTSRCV